MRRVRSALSSLRWKLTVTFVALLAVLLAGLGAFQYLTLQRTLVDTRASALEADYNAALRSGRLEIWPWIERIDKSARRRWTGMNAENWRRKFGQFVAMNLLLFM